jgi:hypothetical protein
MFLEFDLLFYSNSFENFCWSNILNRDIIIVNLNKLIISKWNMDRSKRFSAQVVTVKKNLTGSLGKEIKYK